MMPRLPFRPLVVFFIFNSLACATALAQFGGPGATSTPAQLHGQVRYSEGGKPAYQIRVRLERFDGGIVDEQYTDSSGKFRFAGLRQLTYNVIINVPGYKDISQQVELSTKRSDYIFLTLKSDGSTREPSLGPAVVIDSKVPLPARKEFEKGRTAIMADGKPEEGIAHLEKAISIYPGFHEAYLMLGTTYMDSHQLDKAVGTLRKATEVNSKRPEAYFALGEAYRRQKNYAEAEKTLTEGLKILERSWQGHYILGCVYYETNELVKSGRHVAKTLQLKPDLPEAHLLGGNILLRANKVEDAIIELEEYLRLAPQGKFAPQVRETIAKIKKGSAKNKK
jgi:hypothetical protein